MNTRGQMQLTLALISLAIVSIAVRHYLNTREHVEIREVSACFVISNEIAYFKTAYGTFTGTNADLIRLLRTSTTTNVSVVARERFKGNTVVGLKLISVSVPQSAGK
jgi:hypothetical protein